MAAAAAAAAVLRHCRVAVSCGAAWSVPRVNAAASHAVRRFSPAAADGEDSAQQPAAAADQAGDVARDVPESNDLSFMDAIDDAPSARLSDRDLRRIEPEEVDLNLMGDERVQRSGPVLADHVKETMYKLHQQNPEAWTADLLAKQFKVRPERAAAILWLKQLEKEEEKQLGHSLDDTLVKLHESMYGTCTTGEEASEQHHVRLEPSSPVFNARSEKDFRRVEEDKARMEREHFEKEQREARLLAKEFTERVNKTKQETAGLYKDKYGRRQPKQGWNFVVKEITEPIDNKGTPLPHTVRLNDGNERELSAVEYDFVKRKVPKPRRKPMYWAK
eukprot:jgi/Chlat1/1223/Chrsp115S00747